MTVPKNLGEVRDELLNGYELTNGYYLQLQHSTILVLPALIKGELEPFVCVDRALLKKVWERMPKRHARVTEVLLYANVAKNIAFSILLGDEAEPLHILSEKLEVK